MKRVIVVYSGKLGTNKEDKEGIKSWAKQLSKAFGKDWKYFDTDNLFPLQWETSDHIIIADLNGGPSLTLFYFRDMPWKNVNVQYIEVGSDYSWKSEKKSVCLT